MSSNQSLDDAAAPNRPGVPEAGNADRSTATFDADAAVSETDRSANSSATRGIPGRGTGHEAWSGAIDGRSLASFLGWVGIGLGLAELLAPRGVARAAGLRSTPATTGIIRGLGLREIASGAGILSHPESKEWVGTRVGGDVVDLALLGFAVLKSERPMRTLLASAAVLGIGALDVLAAEELAEARKTPRREDADLPGSHVLRSVTIGCPRSEVYALWRRFTSFPQFMEGIESVEDLGDGRTRWRARGPAGTHVEWDSQIIADVKDELITWQSTEESAVYHGGSVRFADAPRGLGTIVTVDLSYAPPGGKIAAALLKVFRKEPGQQVGDDLRRLKQVLETGEVLLSDASSGTTPRPAQPLPRDRIH